ncbi:galactose-binding domain-containing protein [Glycomyces arizonensis]|uniref:galactose-binding domain-containing protein n=1 Tax=Glycomyces arizonensis TaxID=256035 RepID=UPI00040B983F|nr:hypothetical protein [Glycomyces arizonensis]
MLRTARRQQARLLLAAILAAGLSWTLQAVTAGAAQAQVATAATPSASYTSPWESIDAINGGIDPPQSDDTQNARWGTWPEEGTQWVQLTWGGAVTVASADLYFFDDNGGVRVPASWHIEYLSNGSWQPVNASGAYGTAADQYNSVQFAEVTTTALRAVMQSGAASVGVLEWKAYGEGSGQQNEWNPPSNLVQPLNEVWAHVEDTYNLDFRNFGWDQVMATGGKINYCVRWDSQASVSASLRDGIEAKLQEQYQLWFDQIVGWNDWPFDHIDVNVVGWAAYDRDLLQWSDDSVDIYINDIREDAPQCSEDCGRFFHQDGNYPNCPGGYDRHYDQSLWLTAGMGGGAGGDWGQRMGSEYFTGALGSSQITIYLHELGHTFGLDDFYDWTPTGQCCFIMKAGSSATITEFDQWMLRDWWRHLKGRYGL